MIIFLAILGCANAADNETTDLMAVEDTIDSAPIANGGAGDFSQLNDTISKAEKPEIKLETDYIFNSTKDGDFKLDDDGNVIIFDSFTDKVLKYSIDGRFIDMVKMKKGSLKNTHDCFFLDEDRLFQTCFLMGEQNEIYSYLHFADGIRNNIYTCPMSTSGAMEMVGKHTVSQNSNGCHLIIPFDNNVYKLEGNELKSIISISTEGKLPSENVLRDQKDFSIMTSVNLSDQGYFQGFTGLYETDKCC